MLNGIPSMLTACTNTVLYPAPLPEGNIQYFPNPTLPPASAVPIFSRIAPPESALVVDGGQMIIGEGHALSVYIGGFSPVIFESIRFAFGWWENRICPPPCSYTPN